MTARWCLVADPFKIWLVCLFEPTLFSFKRQEGGGGYFVDSEKERRVLRTGSLDIRQVRSGSLDCHLSFDKKKIYQKEWKLGL